MKVQKISRCVDTDLPEDRGTAGLPGTGRARVSGRQVVIRAARCSTPACSNARRALAGAE